MTDPAIRTEADLRAAITEMQQNADVLAIGLGIADLSALGFGTVTLYDWQTLGEPIDGFSYDAMRYADEPDEYTVPRSNGSGHLCRVLATGATPSQTMASLLSEARAKAAPK